MISTRQLAYRYAGGPALAFADLDLPPDGVLLLGGASGSGKSTWLALVAGLIAPTAGQLEVAGQALAGVLLLTAVLSVFIALWGAVRERRADLALLRMLGAPPGKVAGLLVCEALWLALLNCAGCAGWPRPERAAGLGTAAGKVGAGGQPGLAGRAGRYAGAGGGGGTGVCLAASQGGVPG